MEYGMRPMRGTTGRTVVLAGCEEKPGSTSEAIQAAAGGVSLKEGALAEVAAAVVASVDSRGVEPAVFQAAFSGCTDSSWQPSVVANCRSGSMTM